MGTVDLCELNSKGAQRGKAPELRPQVRPVPIENLLLALIENGKVTVGLCSGNYFFIQKNILYEALLSYFLLCRYFWFVSSDCE